MTLESLMLWSILWLLCWLMSSRLLLRREPSQLNIQKIIDAAVANGKIIDFNANPMRLDWTGDTGTRAAEKGCFVV